MGDTYEEIRDLLVEHSMYVRVSKGGVTQWWCRGCNVICDSSVERFVQAQANHQADVLSSIGIV